MLEHRLWKTHYNKHLVSTSWHRALCRAPTTSAPAVFGNVNTHLRGGGFMTVFGKVPPTVFRILTQPVRTFNKQVHVFVK